MWEHGLPENDLMKFEDIIGTHKMFTYTTQSREMFLDNETAKKSPDSALIPTERKSTFILLKRNDISPRQLVSF